jgi:hypothetical protein
VIVIVTFIWYCMEYLWLFTGQRWTILCLDNMYLAAVSHLNN